MNTSRLRELKNEIEYDFLHYGIRPETWSQLCSRRYHVKLIETRYFARGEPRQQPRVTVKTMHSGVIITVRA